MAKIKIALNPTFKAPVMIPRVGTEPVKVDFEFKYLDRVALAEMFDSWNQARTEHTAKVKEHSLSWAETTTGEIALQVSQVKDITLGWGFDDPFSDQAITELVTTCVSATAAIIDAYQAAYTPARLGN